MPAPEHDRPRVTGESAAQKIWASPVLLGRQEGPLGYGLITISLHVKGVAPLFRLPAAVGFAKATDTASCPAERSVPTTNPSGTSLTALPSNGYAAVVIGAVSGSPAVSYTARSSVCTSVQAASLAKATEVLSVPWQLLSGPRTGSIRLRATLPPCGDLEGISSGGSAKAWTITVGAVVPDVLGRCGRTHSATQTVDLGPPGNPRCTTVPGLGEHFDPPWTPWAGRSGAGARIVTMVQRETTSEGEVLAAGVPPGIGCQERREHQRA